MRYFGYATIIGQIKLRIQAPMNASEWVCVCGCVCTIQVVAIYDGIYIVYEYINYAV